MKSASAALDNHLQQQVTTLATCWRVTRTDGKRFHFTEHDQDLVIDIGTGQGPATYKASSSFNRSSIKNDDTLSVDNLDLTGVLAASDIDETELRRGMFDFAKIEIFIVNWADLTQGILRIRKGWIGEVSISTHGFFQSELRGLTQAFSQKTNELYSAECRADLGDSRCKIPIRPAEVLRNTSYVVGDYVRVNTVNPTVVLPIVNPSFNADLAGWTNTGGAIRVTNDGLLGPQEGAGFARGPGAAADANLSQVIDITALLPNASIDAGLYSFDFSGWRANGSDDPTDRSRILVEFLSAADAVLGVAMDTGFSVITPGNTWVESKVTAIDVPANTRKVRVTAFFDFVGGGVNNAAVDNLSGVFYAKTSLSEDFENRIYKCTTAGTTAASQPVYNETVGVTTADGTAVFTAEEAWSRHFTVVSVEVGNERKRFKVATLTPNTGGPRGGFGTGFFNGGGVVFETGDNAGRVMECREFIADDGVTIEQTIELFLELPFNIQVGDKGRIYPGCDKRRVTCHDRFDNVINMRAEPDVPGADALYAYPDAKA